MTGRPPPEGEAEPSEVRDAWLVVSDGLLAGVGHALNNRVAAMAAVGQVLASTTEGPLSVALAAEATRLQRAVHLLRLLVRHWAREPEPVQLTDVLSDVAELLSHHPDLRVATIRVEATAGIPPVLGERSSLTHAFCMLLIPAAQAAERAGEEGLRVRFSATDAEVIVEIPFAAPPERDPSEPAESDRPPAAAVDPRAARGLIERAGGELSVREEAGELAGLRVRLPTLTELRRRERAASAPATDGPG